MKTSVLSINVSLIILQMSKMYKVCIRLSHCLHISLHLGLRKCERIRLHILLWYVFKSLKSTQNEILQKRWCESVLMNWSFNKIYGCWVSNARQKMPSHTDDDEILCVGLFLTDGGLQSGVHLLLWLQCVPLGHWTPRIGQHIWPVA